MVKLKLSFKKECYIEVKTSFLPCLLQCVYDDGKIRERNIEHVGEMQFVVNLDTSKTLGFIGEQRVKHADVIS